VETVKNLPGRFRNSAGLAGPKAVSFEAALPKAGVLEPCYRYFVLVRVLMSYSSNVYAK
jgi:hypothetical protein